MSPIVRAARKWLAERRAREAHERVVYLLDLQARLGPELDIAMRRRDGARLEAVLLDVAGRDRNPMRTTGRVDNVLPLPPRARDA